MKTLISITLQPDLAFTRVASLVASNVAELFMNIVSASCNTAEFCHAFELSVSESFTNSVRYALTSGQDNSVTIDFCADENSLTVTVIDTNSPFTPRTQAPDITSYPEGGYGLFIINRLMDKVAYTRSEGKNILSMTKHIDFNQASTIS